MKRHILTIAISILMLMPFVSFSFADEIIPGDANGDGRVSVSDASLVLRYCVGLSNISSYGKICADVNCNGRVDTEDAAMIQRDVAKLKALPAMDPLDETLYQNLLKQTTLNYGNTFIEWVARYIKALQSSNKYRAVLYAGATYIGTPYSKMDCSKFVKMAFRDAGISSEDYPGQSSDKTIKWAKDKGFCFEVKWRSDGTPDTSKWESGFVLAYVDANGSGTHLALYVGQIDGKDIIMDSRTYGCDGVRLGMLWWNDLYQLKYYIDPLD